MRKFNSYIRIVGFGIFIAISISALLLALNANQKYDRVTADLTYFNCINTDRVQTLAIKAILEQKAVQLSPELKKRLDTIAKCERQND